MKLLTVYFALVLLVVSLAHAEVFWFEAEGFDEEKSNPVFNEKGVNATWEIKEDTNQPRAYRV